jgi:NAD+ diphosphatase
VKRQQPFTGNRLNRAAAERRDPRWVEARFLDSTSRFLVFRDLEPLIAETTEGHRIVWHEGPVDGVSSTEVASGRAVLLGLDEDGIAHFARSVTAADPAAVEGRNTAFVGTRRAASSLPAVESAIVAQARSLLSWHRDHPICSRCGGPTVSVEGGYSRRCTAQGCGGAHFPRTDPVVIMMVTDGEAALLGRSVRAPPFPAGLFSCLAGYIEPGEAIEEAVRREVREEAGIEVGTVNYHSSQPWPFPSSLMIGCFGEALTRSLKIDAAEVEEVRWFERPEVQRALDRWPEPSGLRLPPPLTAAHRLIRAWLDGEPGTRFPPDSDR